MQGCAGGMLLRSRVPAGTAEPGDGALEVPRICRFICLLLSCCFTGGGGYHKSVKQPIGKQQPWRSLVVPDGRRWRRKLGKVHGASPRPPSLLAIT